MTAPITKRADQIVGGDRIPSEFLPSAFSDEPGEVVFWRTYHHRGEDYTFVAYCQHDNGSYDSTTFLADREVHVYPADTGLAYSRADDGETTQPIAGRVPAHFGAVVNEGGHAAVEVAGGLVEIDPPAPSWRLFGSDAGPEGQHPDGCTWPQVQCIGHASAD